jgi:hypothetical protein
LLQALEEAGVEYWLPGHPGDQSEEAAEKFRSALDAMPWSSAAPYAPAPSIVALYKAEGGEVGTARADRPERPSQPPAVGALVLKPGLDVEELKQLRRRFALATHPDRVPVEFREHASRLMAIANAEIDAALARRS